MRQTRVIEITTDIDRNSKYDHSRSIRDAINALNDPKNVSTDTVYIPGAGSRANEGYLMTIITYEEEQIAL